MDDRTTLPDFQKRYRALSRLAIAAAAGEPVDRLLHDAVGEAVSLVGLVAGAVRIFGAGDQDLAGALGGDQAGQARMQEIESTLLGQLRRNYAVRSLFMTLDLDGPAGLFSYPLKSGGTVIGAISGIARGERNLATEEEFVASMAAMIVLVGRAAGAWVTAEGSPVATPAISKEREAALKTEAVQETAAAINHEINNPLMAVMGNVELLLRKESQIDPETRDKLRRIHEAASRIRQVTQNLMRIVDARYAPYPGGSSILDIDASPKRDDST